MTSVHRARACRARLAGHPGPEWCIPGIGPMTRAAVALLLLAVVTAPLAARAQPAPRVSRIGILWLNPVSATGHLLEAFRQGLRELGYVEGQNFTIEFRSASALQPPSASSRNATRFSAPRGSPAASARAAAVISESIGIPPHLSLPPFDTPALIYPATTNQHVVARMERTTKDTRRTERRAMTTHMTGTREEWLAARLELLQAEKELTRRSDELARRRQELPWVRIDKEYRFESDEGSASLADLFRGRSQLVVYHFMFGPDYTAGCPSCSAIADGFDGIVVHLGNHDVILWAVSRAPLAKLQAYKRRMGWRSPGRPRRRRLQLRLQRLVHRGATARGRYRIQLPAGGGV